MATSNLPPLRIVSVGDNAVSAFVSWRLQATCSCEVTLVWKNAHESVAKYGLSFRSKQFGIERFKPLRVVKSPEEAVTNGQPYDYVLLCVKSLPDLYDLAALIEPVVTPQHTCILVNSTNNLGIDEQLELRYPKNVLLSLVSEVSLAQTGPTEFEHISSTEIWVGPAAAHSTIPASIQNDMATALALTLGTGQVDCKVADNIKTHQFKHMIGPIAFYPASVIFQCPNHSQLLERVGVRAMVSAIVDELVGLAEAQGCSLEVGFKEEVMQQMAESSDRFNPMYRDFAARRPLDLETYLGVPMKLAAESGVQLPRIEVLYAILHHVSISSQKRNDTSPRVATQLLPRSPSVGPRSPMNGPVANGNPGLRNGAPRGPPPRQPPSAMGFRPPPKPVPRAVEDDFSDFSHLVVFDHAEAGSSPSTPVNPPSDTNTLRQREMALRQRELQLMERERMADQMAERIPRRPASRTRTKSFRRDPYDEDDDFVPPPPPLPPVDPDSVDMMSLTSRRSKMGFNASQFRKDPELVSRNSRPPSAFSKFFGGPRNRSSAALLDHSVSGLRDSLLDNPMMAYSNRYANVDRTVMGNGSRTNSMTSAVIPPPSRQPSFVGAPPSGRPMARPFMPPPGRTFPPSRGRPVSPGPMRAPIPKHSPGRGNPPPPQHQLEQQPGVSNSYPLKGPPIIRDLTGSASASAESGDSSGSANVDSENSAHSSEVSLAARQAHAVRVT